MKKPLRRLYSLAASAALVTGCLVVFSPPLATADSGKCKGKESSVNLGWHRNPFAKDQTGDTLPNWTSSNTVQGWKYKDYPKISQGTSNGDCVSLAKEEMAKNHCSNNHTYKSNEFDPAFEADVRSLQRLGQQYVLFKDGDSITTPFVDGIIGPQTWALIQSKFDAEKNSVKKLVTCKGK